MARIHFLGIVQNNSMLTFVFDRGYLSMNLHNLIINDGSI